MWVSESVFHGAPLVCPSPSPAQSTAPTHSRTHYLFLSLTSPLSHSCSLVLSLPTVSKGSIPNFLIWLYWISPVQYAYSALLINEFRGVRSRVGSGADSESGWGRACWLALFRSGMCMLRRPRLPCSAWFLSTLAIVLSCVLLSSFVCVAPPSVGLYLLPCRAPTVQHRSA